MIKTTYEIYPFKASKAKQGYLCIAVKESYSSDTIDSDDIENLLGVGVCKAQGGTYTLVANSINYSFTEGGSWKSLNAKGYKLRIAKVRIENLTSVGNAIVSSTTYTTSKTRGEDSKIHYTTTEDAVSSGSVLVDNLNARDQFAVQALRGMMYHIPNPDALSYSAMAFYCDTAYKWAENMMASAAKVRSVMKDETQAPEEAVVGDLENNTEKLLNNLVLKIDSLVNKIEKGFEDIVEALTEEEPV